MTLPQALAAPRVTQRNTATDLAEPAFVKRYGTALDALGHDVTQYDDIFTGTHEIGAATGIEFGPGRRLTAAAEPKRRGGGSAAVVRPRVTGYGWRVPNATPKTAWTEISTVDELVGLLGEPRPRPRQGPRRAARRRPRLARRVTVLRDGDRVRHRRVRRLTEGRPGRPARARHRRPHHRARRAARQQAGRRLQEHPAEPPRRAELLHPRPRRHAADQRPGAAGQRRAVLRRDGRQGTPAAPRRGRRDRRPVLPLCQGVPALRAVEARDVGARRRGCRAAR